MASTRPRTVTVSIALPWTRARSIWSASRAVGTFRRPISRRIASTSFDWRTGSKARWKPLGRGHHPVLAGRTSWLMLKCGLRVCESYLKRSEGRSHFQMGPIYQIRAHPEFSMAKLTSLAPSIDSTMRDILELLLEQDNNITARAVARLHPTIRSASSITRSEARSALLSEYQRRQNEYRRWRGRVAKQSGVPNRRDDRRQGHQDRRSRITSRNSNRLASRHVKSGW